MIRTLLAAASALALGVVAAQAELKPAVIYDHGGKFDKSFNEAAYTGAEKFKTDTGIEYQEFEIQNDAQREQALRRFAQRGADPIVAIGFSFAAALEKVAPEFPDSHFAIVDMVVDQPNVRSIVFKEEEGSYLVGIMAAMASKTGKVGFIGGMDIPLIRKFECGYKGGVASVGDTQVLANMTGTTPAAWNDPARGTELAKSQFAEGADVVYHAAGGTGIGVIQAAADEGKLAIGVDSNQNGLVPGSVLTSMLKRVDVAVYDTFMDVKNGEWTSGFEVFGLAEDGVGVAMDDNNASLVSTEMLNAVEAAKAKIIAGDVKVHDYMSDSACPY
ncbi:BMP family ABC transporter substrate-binding protein [Albimonas sp. CAU 1670]|uniref:BMP family lipoprotein n=1 Tax=Albimonas sp. CAU 1670 TaxID=3032599 RepID=UPI0023DABDC0|nr:BMP family ABC transporter substrate-binding protein [Albimonas sp. CAU 1670]MDF2231946.1 BMP family ABC transporter substrate-binding protein [Albimonas sp. CAU 1670]